MLESILRVVALARGGGIFEDQVSALLVLVGRRIGAVAMSVRQKRAADAARSRLRRGALRDHRLAEVWCVALVRVFAVS